MTSGATGTVRPSGPATVHTHRRSYVVTQTYQDRLRPPAAPKIQTPTHLLQAHSVENGGVTQKEKPTSTFPGGAAPIEKGGGGGSGGERERAHEIDQIPNIITNTFFVLRLAKKN